MPAIAVETAAAARKKKNDNKFDKTQKTDAQHRVRLAYQITFNLIDYALEL